MVPRALLLALALALLPGALSTAHAEEPNYPTLVGIKGVEVGHRKAGHRTQGPGVGAFVERSFWHHQVDLELSLVAANLGDHLVVPIDVMVKHAHDVGHGVCVFAGAGAAVIVDDDWEQGTSSGLSAAIGAYYWATPHWGIDMEADYNLLFVGESGQEFTLAAGPVVRF